MRVLTALIFLATTAAAHAGQARLARHPAPSPDGSRIAFSWQGDLWLVASQGGRARRLTAHPAADRWPVWSRDGRWIAFASDRHGSYDVFVTPADASDPPRRLTHASVTDIPSDFTPDGEAVLFSSYRDETMRRRPALYRVPLAGGTPAPAQNVLGREAVYAPDGERLAFVRGRTPWWRHGYRGSADRDLWLRQDGGGYRQLTVFDGDDDAPSWIDATTLLYRSERGGRKGLHTLDLTDGAHEEIWSDPDWDVRHPRASADGRTIAFEVRDEIHVLRRSPRSDGDLWQDRRLEIEVASDQVRNPVERHADSTDADELAVSPDGSFAALVVAGDVFVTEIVDEDVSKIVEPPTMRVTATAAREKDLAWAPDGESLVFASDREGQLDLYRVRPAEPESGWARSFAFDIERLTDSSAEEHEPRFSPDGERIAFLRGKGDLMLMRSDGRGRRLLLPHWNTQEFVWAPDGRWIATSYSDMDYNSEVWILSVDGEREPYNVSRHPDADTSPHWSPDGRRLVWLTRRHADTVDVWGVWLAREDDERRPEEWLRYWEDQKASGAEEEKGSKRAGDRRADAAPPPEVRIDFEGLWRRPRALTSLQGDEGSPFVARDGRRIFFTAERGGERDLYSVRWNGEDEQRLTTGGKSPLAPRLSADGKTIYYRTGKGTFARVSTDGKAGDPIPFTARHEIDRPARRRVVFEEAWRALREWFYDPAFHGTDWEAQRERYRPLALAASHPEDFEDVMDLMLGELNASHTNYSQPGGGGGESTGWIGALFDPEAGGPGIRIREVLPDSPAARVDVDLRPGDRILGVGGSPIGSDTNIYALFADTVGIEIPLRVERAREKPRTVTVVPVSFRAQRQLRYEQWTRRARELVEEWSGGRLGYIHIQGMNIPSFEEFERDLQAAGEGKEGLIIDVRSNGGGWTTDYLLAVLEVRRHARTVPRDGDPSVAAYPQGRLPLAAWTRPALALCNEGSFSNAEIFSHAFQTLDRGLLVGAPTFGGVISTGGTRLLNGGWVRLPLRGWYLAGSGVDMENHGAVPDVVVAQPPDEETDAGRDTQLQRAVDLFLARIESDPRYRAW